MGKSKNLEDVGETLPHETVAHTTTTTTNATSAAAEDGEEGGTLIGSIIKNIKVGGDLTSINIAGSLVLPKSSVCYFSENSSPFFNILIKCNDIEDDYQRMLEVFKYLMTTRWLPKELTKKPLNPVLGETFEANVKYSDSDAEITAFAEQISHHPPCTSSEIYCRKAGIKVNYFTPVKVNFMGTYIKLTLDGAVQIHFEKFGETFSCTSPPVAIRLFRGFSEYAGESVLTSSKSKYRIKATYYPKPLLVGHYNCLEATVYNGEEKIQRIKGQWDEELKIAPYKDKKAEYKTFYNKKEYTPGEVVQVSADKQLPTNSNVVWGALFDAIKTGQPGKAINKEKTKVEEEQRRKAAERKEKNEQWKPAHFTQDRDGFWSLNPELHK
ncbi:oxysterol binding family protein [Heterostelium album PN500]|uniref:Oxysterol binding family protein n=1 Tax=Heterostelium pallidum (strain ATCC 26659 / Pp 5 / PN500) TaxID=670386 RepID=D3BCB3_HETP5|nr:oxysterol binding family protein [Heterostelium album PN500]EFA80903.1 oxysterol binding family protein [Heterostelium album PN500]|eukprot:XP_020433021.1 oxysterol binding family protein [Heterostelium album PN500]